MQRCHPVDSVFDSSPCNRKRLAKGRTTLLKSRHNLSILALCTELPVITLLRPQPLFSIIQHASNVHIFSSKVTMHSRGDVVFPTSFNEQLVYSISPVVIGTLQIGHQPRVSIFSYKREYYNIIMPSNEHGHSITRVHTCMDDKLPSDDLLMPIDVPMRFGSHIKT